MKRIISIILFLCVLVSISALNPNKVFACSCIQSSVEEKLSSSSTIFTGTVVSKDTSYGNTFHVDKIWKGKLTDGYVYSGYFSSCGIDLELGKKYLVYTSISKGVESTNLCSGNKLISEANNDILVLNKLVKPEWKNNYLLLFFSAFALVLVVTFILLRVKFRAHK